MHHSNPIQHSLPGQPKWHGLWPGAGLLTLAILAATQPAAAQDSAKPPPEVRFAQAGDHRIAYRVSGEGPRVVVLVSGLGRGMDDFDRVLPELGKFATVITYDRPGYGRSTPAARPADAEAASADLAAVLQQSGLKRPYLIVGHSLGGLYAERYAAEHPRDVAGLVLEESRPSNFVQACTAAGSLPCAPTPEMVTKEPRGVRDEVAGLATTEAEVSQTLPARVPVLVLSRTTPAKPSKFEAVWIESQAGLARKYPGSAHLAAPHSGHDIHKDDAEWFVAQVARFACNLPE